MDRQKSVVQSIRGFEHDICRGQGDEADPDLAQQRSCHASHGYASCSMVRPALFKPIS